MKKMIVLLFILGNLLTISSCSTMDFSEKTMESTTHISDTTEISTEITSQPFVGVTHANVDYEVKILGKDGTAVKPYQERLNNTETFVDSKGETMVLFQHGYFEFYSYEHYITENAEQIPMITLDQDSKVMITVSENGYVTPSDPNNICFRVYGQNAASEEEYLYQMLARDFTLAEILEKGKTEWCGKTVYLSFCLTFTEPHYGFEDWMEIVFFIKTIF